jgi:NAD-dependent dihydropyrimidine dehydrogenase PreA subunit
VITAACIGEKKQTCVETCPVDCIIGGGGDLMLFIDPGLCIDCAACVPVCPVNAIYLESDVPEDQRDFIAINREYFADAEATRRRVRAIAGKAT